MQFSEVSRGSLLHFPFNCAISGHKPICPGQTIPQAMLISRLLYSPFLTPSPEKHGQRSQSVWRRMTPYRITESWSTSSPLHKGGDHHAIPCHLAGVNSREISKRQFCKGRWCLLNLPRCWSYQGCFCLSSTGTGWFWVQGVLSLLFFGQLP